MGLICSLVADANCPLAEETLFVGDAISSVEAFFCNHFNIDWKINTIITTSLPWLIIPEDGAGGKTYASDFVVLAINQKSVTTAKASEMLAHELAHAVRWGKNPEWSEDLFCELINEGLATHIEAEFAKTQVEQTFFLETILDRSGEKNDEILKKLEPKLETDRYDYNKVFFGSNEWPRWAGYSVGYYIVRRYLEKTGKNVFDAIGDSYGDFRAYVV